LFSNRELFGRLELYLGVGTQLCSIWIYQLSFSLPYGSCQALQHADLVLNGLVLNLPSVMIKDKNVTSHYKESFG